MSRESLLHATGKKKKMQKTNKLNLQKKSIYEWARFNTYF